jgi:protein arginine N-methyltransferase 1
MDLEPGDFPGDSAIATATPAGRAATYVVSRSLMLQLDSRGFWQGTNSVSRAAQRIGDDALPVLAAFARPRTVADAFEALREEWDVDQEGLAAIVARLVEIGFLTTPDGAGAALAAGGFAQTLPHFFMIRDPVRVAAYRGAIERHCAGRSVVEIGCGSGILSIFAARAGARSVVAIEESAVADLAARMFEANGCSGVVELRRGNSRDVEIAEPAEVLVHEILGTDPLEENMLFYLADARRRLLRPGGRLIPYRIEVACVGIELVEKPAVGPERAIREARQFEATYGLSFGPLIEELKATPESRFPRRLSFPRGEPFAAPILTGEATLVDLDLRQDPGESLGRPRQVELEVVRGGLLGAVLVFFNAHLDEKAVLSTSPYAPPTHWGWEVRRLSQEVEVAAGTRIALSVEARIERGTERLVVDWP